MVFAVCRPQLRVLTRRCAALRCCLGALLRCWLLSAGPSWESMRLAGERGTGHRVRHGAAGESRWIGDRLEPIAVAPSGHALTSRSSCSPRAASGGCSRLRFGRSRRSRPTFTWKSTIHLGTEYAALLVDAVLSSSRHHRHASQAGRTGASRCRRSRAPATSCSGSAQDVDIQRLRMGAPGDSERSRRRNDYDPDNAWTDAQGFLHLKSCAARRRWTSAEVIHTRSLGYGTYVFVVRDTSQPRSRRGAGTSHLGRAGRGSESSRAGHRDQPVG